MPAKINGDRRTRERRRVGRLRRLIGLVPLVLALSSGCGGPPGPEAAARSATSASGVVPAASAGEEARPESLATVPASLGDGFVVWESNRGGGWRIWTRRLDGSGLRRLTPRDPGRHHCCPHISPDGRWVSYLSSADGRPDYVQPGTRGSLHLVSTADGEIRDLAESALSYFENRAVVWLDANRLLYIDASSATVELDIASGERREWLAGREGERGWLVDATGSHASTGQPTFSLFDRSRKAVIPRSTLGGCQPYFSHDGRWGFWTAGAGGPLNRIDLSTRQVSTILEKRDPLMVEGWGYAYFPMLSRDGRLFAYAASRDRHDHFKSDYEVFVMETDPATLEPLGRAVRITHDPATDRYPDVFLEPLELGRHRGEAPLTVRLEPPSGGPWRWDFGDGETTEAAIGRHTFVAPGRYEVWATSGERRLRAQVSVAPAKAPRVVEASLVEEGRRIRVRFDEAVDLEGAAVTLSSGHPVERWASPDERTLMIELGEPLRRPDRVELAGIVDRAQEPNALAEGVVAIDPPLWPSRLAGLVFLWENGLAPNLIRDPELGAERATTLQATGAGRLDGHGAMVLAGGAFHAEPREQSSALRKALQGRNSLSLELTLTPEGGAGRRRSAGRIVSFASGRRGENFRLLQSGDELVFQLRVGGRAGPHVALFPVPTGRPSHVVVTYTPGRLAAYLDGELVLETDELIGDFFHWRDYPLVFGDEWGGGLAWRGRLEGVAIYDRPLDPAEVRENHLRYRSRLASRPEIARAVVRARLIRRSRVPGLQEISPYRQALALYEYELLETVEGTPPATGPDGRVKVVHWVLMDGEAVAAGRAEDGAVYRLTLEPFASNPQLESLYLSDELGGAGGDAGGGALQYAPDPSLVPDAGAG